MPLNLNNVVSISIFMPPFLFQRKSGDGKRKYWYIGENKRANGEMKRDWEIYIGTTKRLIEIFKTGAVIPNRLRVIEFGLIAAILNLSEELDIIGIIDKHVPKRDQGLSVGEFNLLSILNRCDEPVSKNGFNEWYNRTFLPSVFGQEPEKLNTQNFINHMKQLNEKKINDIEEEICINLIEKGYIDESEMLFLYDPTNIFTFIEFFEEHDKKGKRLPQPGHNKAKRFDLRQINIALMVTQNFGIPVMHTTYGGNINDVTKFKTIITIIIERIMLFIKNCEKITLVFDKGNNCQEAMDNIKDSPLSFVGSLRPSTQKDLFDISLNKFEDTIKNENGEVVTKSYRLERKVFGTKSTLVISFDKNTFKKSLLTFLTNLEGREGDVEAFIDEKLNIKKWTKKKVVKGKIEKILNLGKPKKIFDICVKKQKGKIIVEYRIDQDVLFDHIKYFGKTIHFTDNHNWSDKEIITTYRSKNTIESQIKNMKNPHIIEISPVRHWKDETIRCHIFHCVTALMLLTVLKKKLHSNGVELSIAQMVKKLRDIKQIEFKIPQKRMASRKTVKMDKTEKKIYKILDLEKYEV